MVKLCGLLESVRKAIVRDVLDILQYRCHIDKESINKFLGYGTNRNRSTEERMECNFCLVNEGRFKIRIYEEIWEKQLINDKLIATLFICKDCLNKNKFKFNITH